MKIYRGTKDDKRAFVTEVLSDLLVMSNSGWYGAEYEYIPNQGEFVYLLDKEGERSRKIDVTADSITAKQAVCVRICRREQGGYFELARELCRCRRQRGRIFAGGGGVGEREGVCLDYFGKTDFARRNRGGGVGGFDGVRRWGAGISLPLGSWDK